jgi:predicted amidohydrolase YtcJ
MRDITLALTNGKVYTVDKNDSTATAVAVAGNRIAAVGSTEEILALCNDDTKVVDLHGKAVIPGIVDSHNHVFSAGVLLDGVMLFDARNIGDLKELVRLQAEKLPKGTWIRGGGWIESQFAEYRLPNRHDLDEVAPEHPVMLDRLFGMSVANTLALKMAGIKRGMPDPERGQIDRDEEGFATGILRNGAQSLVRAVMPAGDAAEQVEELERLARLAFNEYPRYGITSLVDPGVSPLGMRAYQNLHQHGQLPIRVNMMPAWYGLYSTAGRELNHLVDTLGVYSGFGGDWLSFGALKMAIDGGLGSKTAMLNEPYADGHISQIPLRLDLDKLEDYFREALAAGWSVGIHCCGDLAQDIAVETFARVLKEFPSSGARHNIIHGYLPSEKSLLLMQENQIAVSCQPGFMYCEGDLYFDLVEQTRIDYFKPLKTYLQNGITVACNSDMTSAHFNPFFGMYAAVARTTSQGRSMGDCERLNRTEMLRMFTINGAYLSFAEERTGSIEVGKLADMAVLSQNIMDEAAVPNEAIVNTEVVMTVIDGAIVYIRAGT